MAIFNIFKQHLLRHRLQSLLMVLGIAVGVSVVVGIDIANQSASKAFDLSTDALTGKATHYISAGSLGIEDEIFVELRRSGFEYPNAPVIDVYATVPSLESGPLQVLGVDPFSDGSFRNYVLDGEEIDVKALTDFLVVPGSVLVSREFAERNELNINDRFDLEYGGQFQSTSVAGILDPQDNLTRRALNGMLIMDIASAQELTGKLNSLDRIDLIIPEDAGEIIQRISAALPQGVVIQEVEARTGTVSEMTAAFRLNLTALSLLALVVALFLIYNAITFSVVQRRGLFGTLRALGVTRREVFLAVLGESLIIGLLGSMIGILIGVALGRGAVQLVTRTINDLFFVVTVQEVPIPYISLVKGALLGVLATMVTAIFPAWEAASVPPRMAMSRAGLESKTRRVVNMALLTGLILFASGAGLLAVPSRNLIVSFGGTFMVVIGLALMVPRLTVWLMKAIRIVTGTLGLIGRLAPGEVVNSLSRTSVAIAALMVSVAVTIGVSVMVGSFRVTVDRWLNQVLQGDIYVSTPGSAVSQLDQPIDPLVLQTLAGWPGVERVDLLQSAVVDSPQGPVHVSANNSPNGGFEEIYISTAYPAGQVWDAVERGEILVSEPLANRLDLELPGATLALYTQRGLKNFAIAGVYSDYASTQGNAVFSMDVYRRHWSDEAVTAVALQVEEGINLDSMAEAIGAEISGIQGMLVRPNRELRRDSLKIFDQTFAITGALQIMTIFVAFIGILSAMMSLQLDKLQQLGIFKAIGFTARQMWALVLIETGLMGSAAGLFAIPTGYILAFILIYVINRRSFGWTLQINLEPAPFVLAMVISVLAALLAGLYPAFRIYRRSAADTIRYE